MPFPQNRSRIHRTLETISWQYAEPVLRFVVRDLYFLNGRQDRYYQPNTARVERTFAVK